MSKPLWKKIVGPRQFLVSDTLEHSNAGCGRKRQQSVNRRGSRVVGRVAVQPGVGPGQVAQLLGTAGGLDALHRRLGRFEAGGVDRPVVQELLGQVVQTGAFGRVQQRAVVGQRDQKGEIVVARQLHRHCPPVA